MGIMYYIPMNISVGLVDMEEMHLLHVMHGLNGRKDRNLTPCEVLQACNK